MIAPLSAEEDFGDFSVVSCAVLVRGQVLFLHRNPDRQQGNRWGFPTGKVQTNESHQLAMIRELFEETGLIVDPDQLEHFRTYAVKWPDAEFSYTLYLLSLDDIPSIQLCQKEHSNFSWCPLPLGLNLNLVDDARQILSHLIQFFQSA